MLALEPIASELPHWSPFAIAFGLVMGYLAGAMTIALWWLHRERKRSAGSGLRDAIAAEQLREALNLEAHPHA